MTFATQNCVEGVTPILSLLVLNVKTSKSIAEFSYYQKESELLLEPYSEFLVTSKKENVMYAHPLSPNLKYPFTVYEMDEIETKRELPPSNANFIIWIDDKPNEGQFLFDMVTEFSQPTILVQLLST